MSSKLYYFTKNVLNNFYHASKVMPFVLFSENNIFQTISILRFSIPLKKLAYTCSNVPSVVCSTFLWADVFRSRNVQCFRALCFKCLHKKEVTHNEIWRWRRPGDISEPGNQVVRKEILWEVHWFCDSVISGHMILHCPRLYCNWNGQSGERVLPTLIRRSTVWYSRI